MVLLLLYPITLLGIWILSIAIAVEIQPLLPKECFYIEGFFRGEASLKARETDDVIDDILKASLTKDDVIYVLGHDGFYVIDLKNEIMKIVSTTSSDAAEYRQKKYYMKTGKDNIQIVTEEDLTMEEREVMEKLREAAYLRRSTETDIEVYTWW